MKNFLRAFIVVLSFLFGVTPPANAQQQGDTVYAGNKKVVLTGTNLISNAGFEDGFSGWTDGTSAPLSSEYFTIMNAGGVNNSNYLVGTTNAGNTTAGAIATGWDIEPGKTYYFSYQVKYQDASTDPAPEVWLKTSLTNNSSFQEETFKLIDTTYVDGGGEWTRNDAIFTNTNPSYDYIVARFRWLNNRFGFDDFALYEANEVPNTEGLQLVIDEANELYDVSADGAGELHNAIDAATNLLTNSSVEEVHQGIIDLNKAILAYRVANTTGVAPDVITDPNFARGATMFFGRSTINGNIESLLEHGFCWSTHPEPTILDNRTTNYFSNNGFIYHIENLTPSTVYYLRAYVLTPDHAVGYGDVIKVITIPEGTVAYTLSSNITEEHYTRIDNAMSSAVNYYNDLTSIQGLSLDVNYGSGTPTAEASYGGWMRFGPDAGYQQTGTALHEIGHTIGVGTHSMWRGPSSPLRETGSGGAWLGDRTTKLLQFLDNDPESYLRGDATHMWPYGINGAHEDDGTAFLYIANSLISQALGEDGLPPTGGFATPAYTFETKDNTNYYLKSEDEQTGLYTSFVVADADGNLVNRVMTPDEALMNDNAAWQFQFNPDNGYYTIKNAGTDMYFTYTFSGNNGIRTVSTSTPGSEEHFQLMMGRVDVSLESLTKRGYWIVHPEHNNSPDCFTASTDEGTMTSDFNISNAATTQRWLILSEDEVWDFGLVTANDKNEEESYTSLENQVYAHNGVLHVESSSTISDIMIYNVNGALITEANNTRSPYSQRLQPGIYIVMITSSSGQASKKVVVY